MRMENKNRQELMNALHLMDEFTHFKKFKCPPLYLIGGSGCIIAKYFTRATLDFDILDVGYQSKDGAYLNILGDKDLLDFYLTTVPKSFKNRAIQIEEFQNIQVFVLSKGDIILSKIGRYSKIDQEDISLLLPDVCRELLKTLKEEVLQRDDLSPVLKDKFIQNYKRFEGDFYV